MSLSVFGSILDWAHFEKFRNFNVPYNIGFDLDTFFGTYEIVVVVVTSLGWFFFLFILGYSKLNNKQFSIEIQQLCWEWRIVTIWSISIWGNWVKIILIRLSHCLLLYFAFFFCILAGSMDGLTEEQSRNYELKEEKKCQRLSN